jgi:hypothetical protein
MVQGQRDVLVGQPFAGVSWSLRPDEGEHAHDAAARGNEAAASREVVDTPPELGPPTAAARVVHPRLRFQRVQKGGAGAGDLLRAGCESKRVRSGNERQAYVDTSTSRERCKRHPSVATQRPPAREEDAQHLEP